MIIFCPICSSALSVAPDKNNQNRFECRSCPYINPVTIPYFDRTKMKRKEVDDVLGGEGSWDNVDRQDNGMFDFAYKSYYLQALVSDGFQSNVLRRHVIICQHTFIKSRFEVRMSQ
jgi:hypothetical protein